MTILYVFILLILLALFLVTIGTTEFYKFVVFCIFIIILLYSMYDRISKFLVLIRYNKEISQFISLKLFLYNLFRNNFDKSTGNIKSSYTREVIKSKKDFEKFVLRNRGKEFKFTTHKIMID